jgi:uncharacterized protein (DUF1684 family)
MSAGKKRLLSIVLAPVVVIAAMALAAGCGGAEDPETASYVKAVEEWRAERVERLTRPDGWLSLAGLYWLEEGSNSFGSDPSNDVVLPEGKTPARMGSLVLNDGAIRMVLDAGVDVTSDGQVVGSMDIRHDGDEEHGPTLLTHGSITWYAIKRGDRIGIRVKDSESRGLTEFAGIESYAVDPRMRIEGVFEPLGPDHTIEITNAVGVVSQERSPGVLVFEVAGETHRLAPIAYDDESDFFVVFGDRTSGRETYGGGRFLAVERPGDDGKVVIDFNKAYNPPCAFTKYATCPLPPEQNVLAVQIRAGEKTYKKPGH